MYEVDVLVAGGGIAGALVAGKLSEQGYRCMLVEPAGFGAAQSGHSHGYLHRGYIYLTEGDLVRELKGAREQWKEFLLRPQAITPSVEDSLIGFENPQLARFASGTWSSAGLPVNQVMKNDRPFCLKNAPVELVFRTDEQSFDFSRVFKNLAARLAGCALVLGSVSRLIIRNGGCTSVEVNVQGKIQRVKPRFVVLAAGTHNSEILLNTFGRFRFVPVIRTSYMLVVVNSSLPHLSLVLPENKFYGLFLVSRKRNGQTIWLVSNYLAYGGECDIFGVTARTWTKAMLKTFYSVFPPLMTADLRLGIYSAPKAELRLDPERLPPGKMIEDFDLTNVVAVWPTKLTLGPSIASDIVDRIVVRLKTPGISKDSAPTWATQNQLGIALERWNSVKLYPRSDFERQVGLH